MRGLKVYGLVVLFAALVAGCDSGSDELSESELFVGTWTVAGVSDSQGDRTAVVTALGDLTATFTDAGNYTLLFEPADGSADQSGSNTYSVNETANVLTLNATSPQTGSLSLPVTYSFANDDRVVLAIPALAIQIVATVITPFQALQGDVSLTLQREN